MDPAARELAELRRHKLLIGSLVFAALMVLDTIEYVVALLAEMRLLWMTILAVPQIGLIAWFYMHVYQLTGEGEH
jgi:cytochrome c oxidase subunit IV